MAYATVEDLIAGWRTLSSDEEAAAMTLLDRASALLTTLMQRHNITIDPDNETQRLNLCSVCCAMVKRSMTSIDAANVSSMSQTVGSVSTQVTYSNPEGSLYLTKFDKELLGIIGKGGYRQLRAAIRTPDGSPVDGW